MVCLTGEFYVSTSACIICRLLLIGTDKLTMPWDVVDFYSYINMSVVWFKINDWLLVSSNWCIPALTDFVGLYNCCCCYCFYGEIDFVPLYNYYTCCFKGLLSLTGLSLTGLRLLCLTGLRLLCLTGLSLTGLNSGVGALELVF